MMADIEEGGVVFAGELKFEGFVVGEQSEHAGVGHFKHI